MTSLPHVLASLSAASLLTLASGCSSSGEDPTPTCTGAKCDDLDLPDSEVPDSPCDGIMVDRSGRKRAKVAGRLHDPVAEALFKQGDDCPLTLQDILAKVRQNDAEGCAPETAGAGMTTRAISETAQLAGAPTSYRLVTSRACNGRQNHEMLFSIFGVGAGDAELPTNVEMIGFDSTSGVFNYYETLPDGSLNFFGNSKDFLKGPGSGTDRRCAGCHVGGGLIMKELEAPWLHWEGDTQTPGVPEVLAAHPELGRQSNGIELESTVTNANRDWNEKRLQALKEVGDTRTILRPLFCDLEINLRSGGPVAFDLIPDDFMLADAVSNFPSLPVEPAIYAAAIAASGQGVGDTGKADTFFPFAFIHKATLDTDYVQTLQRAGIVDEDFVRDVMMVDFTRAVFSDDRCDLLDFAPSIPVAGLTAQAVKDGFLANLASAPAGSPAAELRTHLATADAQSARVDAYVAACKARLAADAAGFLADVLKVASLQRDRARELPGPIMEFPETMPDDDLDVAAGTRFDPLTCELRTSFVATAPQ